MSITPQSRKIAIVGASGTLGQPLLAALLASPAHHTITAVQRTSSPSVFPPSVLVLYGDLSSQSFLASAFTNQDVVVLMPPLPQLIAIQEPAVRAAAEVGVPWVFPAEFGPDPFAKELIAENELLQRKKQIRDLIEELGRSSWVSVVVGPWMEYGVGMGLWGVDGKRKEATLWKGAEGKANSASAKFAGEAVAAVLGLPEEDLRKVRNGAVYTPSVRFSQRELLEAVQRVTGGEGGWKVEEREVEDVRRDYEEGLKRGEEEAGYRKFFVTHVMEGKGGDFERKIDRELEGKLKGLGMGEETLEEAIRAALV